jgi:hypothetical protein
MFNFLKNEINVNTIGAATATSLQFLFPEPEWTKAQEEELRAFALEVRKALDDGDVAVVDIKTGKPK